MLSELPVTTEQLETRGFIHAGGVAAWFFLLKAASSMLLLQLWAALAGKLPVQHSPFRVAQIGDFLQDVSSQRPQEPPHQEP